MATKQIGGKNMEWLPVANALYFQLQTFGFYKMPEISWYAESQIGSEVGHAFMKSIKIVSICSHFQLASLLLLIMLATCCSAGSKV
jgi:hypothetical protein